MPASSPCSIFTSFTVHLRGGGNGRRARKPWGSWVSWMPLVPALAGERELSVSFRNSGPSCFPPAAPSDSYSWTVTASLQPLALGGLTLEVTLSL